MIRRFNRYELKYVIPTSLATRLKNDLHQHVTPDSHGDTEGHYPVVSLYFDSADLSAFWSKIEGIKFRRKLRIRIYPGTNLEETQTAMVEIKQRINRTVQKKRLCLPLKDAESLCRDDFDIEHLSGLDKTTAHEILYLIHSQQLRPAAITSYLRQAFMGGIYDRGLRITFDTRLGGRTHGLKVNAPLQNRLFAPNDWCIMEVKVDETIPPWLVALLARHQCQLQRVSKYCAVITLCKNLSAPEYLIWSPDFCPSTDRQTSTGEN